MIICEQNLKNNFKKVLAALLEVLALVATLQVVLGAPLQMVLAAPLQVVLAATQGSNNPELNLQMTVAVTVTQTKPMISLKPSQALKESGWILSWTNVLISWNNKPSSYQVDQSQCEDEVSCKDNEVDSAEEVSEIDHDSWSTFPSVSRRPINEGSKLTKLTCIALILALDITHISLHLLERNNFVKLFHYIKSYLPNYKKVSFKSYFCKEISKILCSSNTICPRGSKESGTFLTFSISEVLKAMFKRDNFRQHVSHKFHRNKKKINIYEDIYFGKIYKHYSSDGNVWNCENNISFMLYTDCVQLYKSSKYNIWPLLLVNNECSEFKQCFHSVPVLQGILLEPYFSHYGSLVAGCYILCQESISEEETEFADKLLRTFVEKFEDLYGLQFMTANFHTLIHLADTVRELGPLWVTFCFAFEDLNGRMTRLTHGTRFAEIQICQLFVAMQFSHI
ncbi:hypothetical protein B566_EDAN004497 [Ephemera danica]|nr:hypothetical protein B566_EDAN004497 [Ephemera danica]